MRLQAYTVPLVSHPKLKLIRTLGLQAYACFPLLAEERLVGTLSFGSRHRQEFNPEEVELLRTVSHYVAVAQEQAGHRQHLEQIVQERTAALREMIAELEHMSYSMVHHMPAPLRAIEGFANLVRHREAARLRPQSQELLSRMQHSVNQMDRLITDALNYNKAVRSRLPIGVVDLSELLRDLLDTYIESKPPHAEVVLEGEFPPVLANALALSQCLAELLRNALKFVQPGRQPVIKV